MIITKEEAVNLLANNNNMLKDDSQSESFLIDSFVDTLISPERPPLAIERGERRIIPPIFREIIAITSNITGNRSSTAGAYGISSKQTGRLHNGHVNPIEAIQEKGPRQSDIDLTKALEKSMSIVRDKALDKIGKSLDYIRDEALELEAPKTLSMIAANLSRVVSSTIRDKQQFGQINVQTVFYSPKSSAIGEYDVIDVESR